VAPAVTCLAASSKVCDGAFDKSKGGWVKGREFTS
jgi:hypothetical protein